MFLVPCGDKIKKYNCVWDVFLKFILFSICYFFHIHSSKEGLKKRGVTYFVSGMFYFGGNLIPPEYFFSVPPPPALGAVYTGELTVHYANGDYTTAALTGAGPPCPTATWPHSG